MVSAWSLRKPSTPPVAGLDEQARRKTLRGVQAHGTADTVRIMGYVSNANLSALLIAAEALAYPSLSEDFGLPIIYAWTGKTAVLTGNTTDLPEITGDAAVLLGRGRSAKKVWYATDEMIYFHLSCMRRESWRAAARRAYSLAQRALLENLFLHGIDDLMKGLRRLWTASALTAHMIRHACRWVEEHHSWPPDARVLISWVNALPKHRADSAGSNGIGARHFIVAGKWPKKAMMPRIRAA